MEVTEQQLVIKQDPREDQMECYNDREQAVREFDQTKAGVKGLVDSGIATIPRIFHHQPENRVVIPPPNLPSVKALHQVPIIDFAQFDNGDGYLEIVDKVLDASQIWGAFQVVNHGVPLETMEEMLGSVKRFHEQPGDLKSRLYSRDVNQRVRFFSNGDLLTSKIACWRDSISYDYQDSVLDPQEIPLVCRKAVTDYMEGILKLREKLCQVLSQALGLQKDYLTSAECMKTANLVCHYYPACPEPELTLGAKKHSDPSFMTILLQDNTGGLQVFHGGEWVDLQPATGALAVNLGDMMQLISNGKFKSVEHRVIVRKTGPRVSVPCFYYPSTKNKTKPYGPLKELLLLEGKQPIYREISAADYLACYKATADSSTPRLPTIT